MVGVGFHVGLGPVLGGSALSAPGVSWAASRLEGGNAALWFGR